MACQLVELCAGTAAVSLSALGAPKFPATRIGSKQGYADAILEIMRLRRGDCSSAVLVEADPGLCGVLESLFHAPRQFAEAVSKLRGLQIGSDFRIWEEAKGKTDPASVLIRMAGARGGIGGFRGKHKLRPAALSIPAALVDRLHGFARFRREYLSGGPIPVTVVCQDVWQFEPLQSSLWRNAIVYIDPPYEERQSYGFQLSAPVEKLAVKWAQAGFKVYVSEARELEGAFETFDITDQRRGQSRRSLTRSNREIISYFKPNM